MMNIDGKSSTDKESIINIGLHVEAIDEDGNWSEAEIINIIDNNLILKFLDRIETYNRIIDISSNKWHHIDTSKSNNFNFHSSDFEKGDFVLAKWHDDNYYLSQILDITTKTKYGTKVKEYHILYLYDNVHEIVPKSRLKCSNSTKNNYCDFNNSNADNIETLTMSRPLKKHYKRRSEALDSHENDNVFYDEKTKKFTENCKLRRLKLSNKNGDSSDCVQSNNLNSSPVDITQSLNEIAINQKNMQSPIINHVQIQKLNCDTTPTQRYSQRKRRSSYKKADYFYPDSIDNMLKEKNKSSNNNSQVSTPIPFETNDEISSSSPKLSIQYAFQNSLEVKDGVLSLNQSPISVSLTSTECSPNSKQKTESFLLLDEKDDVDVQVLYKINDDGKYQCLICTNKTFRKKQLVFDHIKYYHPTSNEQSNDQSIPKLPKPVYSPNKRYYSSYLKTNRTSIERKKKFNKSKIKSLINRNSWNIYNNRNHKSDYRLSSSRIDRMDHNQHGLRSLNTVPGPSQRQTGSITYCHRCKKSSECGPMIQCDVCLCWSHAACYGLGDSKDNDSFWECDNCANVTGPDGTKTSHWFRDRCRFHSISRNELPWLTKNAALASPCSIRNVCEMQSFLSLCLRVLEAITRHMDRFKFRNCNDSSSQDDLDILKTFGGYDNIDDMNMSRIETLDSLALNVDQEDLFRVAKTVPSSSMNINCNHYVSSQKIFKSDLQPDIIPLSDSDQPSHSSQYHFHEVGFINSTPNKLNSNSHSNNSNGNNNNNKSVNASFDGILDCEIQQWGILPEATFDALVDDFNMNDDICKTSNLSNHSKSSILDLIDDNCKVSSSLVSLDPGPSINSLIPFTTSSCLCSNQEIDVADSMIELSNEDIASLLLDKHSQKPNSIGENECVPDNHRLECLVPKYSSDFVPESAAKHHHLQSTASNSPPSESFIRDSSLKLKLDSQEVAKIDLTELPDWPSDIHGTSSSVLADSDPHLSSSDSKCLEWLLSKYQCVERIVESIESTVDSGRIKDESVDMREEDEFCQMSRYLHSLLYILR